jgi:hypothetical protein
MAFKQQHLQAFKHGSNYHVLDAQNLCGARIGVAVVCYIEIISNSRDAWLTASETWGLIAIALYKMFVLSH